MKRKLMAFMFAGVMSLSFAVPVVAAEAVATAIESQGVSPHTFEQTRTYWRVTANGQLQWRLWGITSARWLSDWTYV